MEIRLERHRESRSQAQNDGTISSHAEREGCVAETVIGASATHAKALMRICLN